MPPRVCQNVTIALETRRDGGEGDHVGETGAEACKELEPDIEGQRRVRAEEVEASRANGGEGGADQKDRDVVAIFGDQAT